MKWKYNFCIKLIIIILIVIFFELKDFFLTDFFQMQAPEVVIFVAIKLRIQVAVGVFRNYMTSIILYIFAQTSSFGYIYQYHYFKIVRTQSVKVCSYWLTDISSVVVARRSASSCDKASLHLGPQILPWPSIDQTTN